MALLAIHAGTYAEYVAKKEATQLVETDLYFTTDAPLRKIENLILPYLRLAHGGKKCVGRAHAPRNYAKKTRRRAHKEHRRRDEQNRLPRRRNLKRVYHRANVHEKEGHKKISERVGKAAHALRNYRPRKNRTRKKCAESERQIRQIGEKPNPHDYAKCEHHKLLLVVGHKKTAHNRRHA